jgi:hypothetical protein
MSDLEHCGDIKQILAVQILLSDLEHCGDIKQILSVQILMSDLEHRGDIKQNIGCTDIKNGHVAFLILIIIATWNKAILRYLSPLPMHIWASQVRNSSFEHENERFIMNVHVIQVAAQIKKKIDKGVACKIKQNMFYYSNQFCFIANSIVYK